MIHSGLGLIENVSNSENEINSFSLYSKIMFNITLPNITRYDYNLMIMKSPKPATDTIYPHIKF